MRRWFRAYQQACTRKWEIVTNRDDLKDPGHQRRRLLQAGVGAAAAIIVTLPVFLLTIVIQREILTGMTTGGVKGG